MPRQLGKQALLDAAAVLIDERGVDNVTLQDIGQASGHRNRSAVQYHFGSRVAVIQAVISQTMDPIDAERNMLLDHLPAPVAAERTSQVIGFIIRACGDQARLMDSDPPPRPVLSVEDFTVNLVDTIMAIIQAPTSIAASPAAAGG